VSTIKFIGDVHGKLRLYERIIEKSKFPTVQVGDMGLGFRNYGDPISEESNIPERIRRNMFEGNHRFLRGNHDNPRTCKEHPQYIPDGTIENDIMFIGGASSIDKAYRTPGYSWWEDEELSQEEFADLIEIYITKKPKIMVTHTCPQEIALYILDNIIDTKRAPNVLMPGTLSEKAFQHMFSAHSPEVWVFGHWHIPFDHVYSGTRFICLPELDTIDISLDDTSKGEIIPFYRKLSI
jgi:hypothetical protein